MAYVLIALGIVVAYLDYLGTANVKAAGSLAYEEIFTAPTPFWKWAGALIIIGAIGYVPELEPVATAFLVLVLLVIVLSHSSGFSGLVKGL